MKHTAIVGVLLVLLGVAALAYQGITYTTHDTVIDVGPIHATAEHHNTVRLPPVLAAIAVVGGVVLLIGGLRRPA